MSEKFYSKALEANLAETRYKDIVIPENLQHFIGLSEKYYGIHKRALECIIEYLHPFSNRLFVVEQLREILISDFWFYSTLDNGAEAFAVPVGLYDDLLKSCIREDLGKLIVKTLLEFADRLNKENKETLFPAIHLTMEVLSRNLEANEKAYIISSRFFIKFLDDIVKTPEFTEETVLLVKNILQHNIDFWDESTQIEQWYDEKKELLIDHFETIMAKAGKSWFDELRSTLSTADSWEKLKTGLPVFDEIADHFGALTNDLKSFIDKFFYTFYLLHLPGMQNQKDRLIWNINKVLRSAVDEVDENDLFGFTDRIFSLCEELREEHTSAVLDCILTLGKRIVDRDSSEDKHFINYFEKKLIDFGFETPGIVYVNKDWQINVNENHIKNIRVWLELIEYPQTVMEKLLSALIVNLKMGGIFISDTDLFQREITKVLNSNIAPFYKKVKQLTRIFPVYFHEIGAEGEIRNVTTNMDEVNHRQDRLVHFLRKQVHTESNNTLIDLTRRIFKFWSDGNKASLQPFLPVDVFESIDLESEYFTIIHTMVTQLGEMSGLTYEQLLELKNEVFEAWMEQLPQEHEKDLHRLDCIHALYALLKEKYSFETVDIISILRRYAFIEPSEISRFDNAMKEEDFETALLLIYHFMEQLKKIIFNPEPTQAWENIYHKRHIAIGIPSMYGTYREPKFEAIGLTFRLENIATRLMEKIVDRINLDYVSAKTLKRVLQILEFFKDGLELDGIYNQGFNSNLDMFRYSLTSRSFSLQQYINIFQFIAENVKVTIDKYFLRSYEYPLKIIIPKMFFVDHNYSDKEKVQLISQKSEEFYRDIISQAFLVQPLDNMISRVLNSLHNMVDKYPSELINDVMSYNSDLIISPLYQETKNTDNQIFLGSKAFFLKKLYLAGFPVPPGFVLTTEVFRRRNAISNHYEIGKEMDELIMQHLHRLERITGKELGNPKNPLLLSVRSGTAISMPGAMDTFLNVGMNDELTDGLSKQHNFGWTSWDCYRRLLQSWGMANGIHRDVFDTIMRDYKKRHNVDLKMYFKPEVMKEISLSYRKALDEHQVYFEQDLVRQLKYTINCVFDSWDSDRAKVYRKHMNIANDWGTAVIVQKMILGNLNYISGTGVVFTQNPHRERPGVHLYGDFTLCSQGEDIVAGLVTPLPVGETQRKYLELEGDSLQTKLPEIYRRIHKIATKMTEDLGFSPQEIEFTFESENSEDLFILQTRDQDLHQPTRINVFSSTAGQMKLVGRGIGIGGSAMNGIVAIDKDDLISLARKFPGERLILVRPDTVPDDIGMIFECDGLLTAKGGATSHAAVTAVRLGKTCVVNCTDMIVNDILKECQINSYLFKPGDKIAIDGHHGNIFKGHYPIETTEIKAML
ncbi:MAG: pyruvate phosphate dikinase [Bacteroidales bacterium]|nr:pyruvate phosphate dikinase [Bacteroidales bacterium]